MSRVAHILLVAWTAMVAATWHAPAHGESLGDKWLALWERGAAPPQKPHPAVVRVIVPEEGGMQSLGSGTLVDANDTHGLVVSNWHVVEGARGTITVVFPDGFRSPAQVLKTDRDWDLAALLIRRPSVAPVPIAARPPAVGELLTIAGYGSGRYRAASGNCTQFVSPGGNHPYEMVELAAAARQGDSGGPIFNARGELAGVLFGEGGGLTSGSHCRRVHWFLAPLKNRLASPLDAPPMVAQSSFSPTLQQPMAITSLAPVQRMESSTPSVSPPFVATTVSPAAAIAPRTAVPPVSNAPQAARQTPSMSEPARFVASPPSVVSGMGNFAAPNIERPANSPFPWEAIVGSSRPEQLKSALAGIGLLAMLLWTHRWVQGGKPN